VTSIAAIGNLSLDRVSGAPPRPGGTVFYSARTLALLGSDAQIAASCATADRAALIPRLEAFGLPATWYEAAATTAFSFRYVRSGRRIMRLDAVGKQWSPEDALAAAGDARWVHIGSLVRTDFPSETLAALVGAEKKLLVDAQGLVRTAALGPLRANGEIGDVLEYVRMLKLDDSEAATLVGSADPDRLRSLGVPEVILTLGAKGSILVLPDRFEAVPAVDIQATVDPTGAGDAYAAAYLAARSNGAEPLEAARTATRTTAELLAAS